VIDDLLDEPASSSETGDADQADADEPGLDEPGLDEPGLDERGTDGEQPAAGLEVYGDSAYADGQTLREQVERGNDLRAKMPPVRNSRGYSKDQFTIDRRRARSPARLGTPCRSARSAVAGRPGSAICAEAARCARRAPQPEPGG
jgi:hypothetical protein